MESTVRTKASLVGRLHRPILEKAHIKPRMRDRFQRVRALSTAFAVFDDIELALRTAWAMVQVVRACAS